MFLQSKIQETEIKNAEKCSKHAFSLVTHIIVKASREDELFGYSGPRYVLQGNFW